MPFNSQAFSSGYAGGVDTILGSGWAFDSGAFGEGFFTSSSGVEPEVDVIIDPINKRIILTTTTITAAQMYSRIVDWQAVGDNLKYGRIIRQVGSDNLGGGISIPPYFFLQGAWRVRPMEANHDLDFIGNLFVEGGGNPVVPTLGNYNVIVKNTVPVQAQAFNTGGSGSVDLSGVYAALAEISKKVDDTQAFVLSI